MQRRCSAFGLQEVQFLEGQPQSPDGRDWFFDVTIFGVQESSKCTHFEPPSVRDRQNRWSEAERGFAELIIADQACAQIRLVAPGRNAAFLRGSVDLPRSQTGRRRPHACNSPTHQNEQAEHKRTGFQQRSAKLQWGCHLLVGMFVAAVNSSHNNVVSPWLPLHKQPRSFRVRTHTSLLPQ